MIVFAEMIDSRVDHDAFHPTLEGGFHICMPGVKLIKGPVHFQKTVIHYLGHIVMITAIAHADSRSIAVEVLIELFLATPVSVDTTLDDITQMCPAWQNTRFLICFKLYGAA